MSNLTNATVTLPSEANVHQVVLWLQAPIGVAIVVGNILNLVTLPHATKIQMSLRVLMANMSIGDTLVGLVFVVNCFVFYKQHLLTPSLCALRYGIIYTALFMSTSSVSVMAIDRCLTIKFPYKYLAWINAKKAVILSVLLWSFHILMAVAALYRPIVNFTICRIFIIARPESLLMPGVMVNIFMFIAIVAYIIICREVRRHVNQIAALANQPQPLTNVHPVSSSQPAHDSKKSIINPCSEKTETFTLNKYKAATTTVTMIFGTYVCCNAPLIVTLIHLAVNPHLLKTEFYKLVGNGCLFLMVLNSLANPIIYQLRMKPMRIALLKVLGVKRFNSRVSTMTIQTGDA